MRLRARDEHVARIDARDHEVEFQDGEAIPTQISSNVTRAQLEHEYAVAGLELLDWHTDDDELFGLSLTAPA
jgi:uncharacterized SAM-dependent methyltransferase